VETQDVVLGQTESADGGGYHLCRRVAYASCIDAARRRQVVLSLARVFIGLGMGPFAQAGLNESFGVAIGLGRIGSGADVPQPETLAAILEVKGPIAGTVVGHHALDLDAEACVVGDRAMLFFR
jgi:hypothetical protein